MTENMILYGRQEEVCAIRMCGRITHALGDDFDVLIETEILEEDPPTEVIFDLSELESIDSTILGLLAKVARRRFDASLLRPTLLSPTESVSRILASMGFEAVFDIVHASLLSRAKCEPIPKAAEGARDKGRLMLEAHRLLQDMNESNREEFRTVVEILDMELRRKRTTST